MHTAALLQCPKRGQPQKVSLLSWCVSCFQCLMFFHETAPRTQSTSASSGPHEECHGRCRKVARCRFDRDRILKVLRCFKTFEQSLNCFAAWKLIIKQSMFFHVVHVFSLKMELVPVDNCIGGLLAKDPCRDPEVADNWESVEAGCLRFPSWKCLPQATSSGAGIWFFACVVESVHNVHFGPFRNRSQGDGSEFPIWMIFKAHWDVFAWFVGFPWEQCYFLQPTAGYKSSPTELVESIMSIQGECKEPFLLEWLKNVLLSSQGPVGHRALKSAGGHGCPPSAAAQQRVDVRCRASWACMGCLGSGRGIL